MIKVSDRKQVSYEVYVKDRSGRWQIHGHYSSAQKKQAEEEAKQLERANHVSGVKVIREVYSHGTNSSEEYVLYQTRDQGNLENSNPQAKPKRANKPQQRPVAGPEAGPSLTKTATADHKQKPNQTDAAVKTGNARTAGSLVESQSLVGLALKIVVAFCLAIAVGLATMFLAARGLEFLPSMGVAISQGFYDKANFLSFVIGFLLSLVPMLMALTQKFKGRARKSLRPYQHQTASSRHRPGHPKTKPQNNARRKTAAEMAAEVAREESGSETENETENTAPSQREIEASAEDPGETSSDGGLPEKPLSETQEIRATRAQMRDFITGSIQAIQRTVPSLDAYHKFGVNLYVAGACDACSEKHALDQKDGRTILRDCISALGANKNMADTFCKNVDAYILEPKYKDMYGAGRESMSAYIENEKSLSTSVSKAISGWNEKPAAGLQGASKGKLHALMFTDIVNSTAKTQELGDHGAQQMVHIHNQIVRTALINNYGKEVKHMGDGIMAVFPSSASSVEAAIEIQKNMASHNATQDLKFQIRIGINAGEAITEENDLFGSVVQLAARVCAQASGDETLVSENVKNTYTGKRAHFVSQGHRQMKGFKEPLEVFQVQART